MTEHICLTITKYFKWFLRLCLPSVPWPLLYLQSWCLVSSASRRKLFWLLVCHPNSSASFSLVLVFFCFPFSFFLYFIFFQVRRLYYRLTTLNEWIVFLGYMLPKSIHVFQFECVVKVCLLYFVSGYWWWRVASSWASVAYVFLYFLCQ